MAWPLTGGLLPRLRRPAGRRGDRRRARVPTRSHGCCGSPPPCSVSPSPSCSTARAVCRPTPPRSTSSPSWRWPGALVGRRAFAGRHDHRHARERSAARGPAAARARRELRLLVERTPRDGPARAPATAWTEYRSDEVVPGDRLVVGTGEVVPVDGRLLGDAAPSTSRRSRASRCRSSARRATTCAAASSTPARRSTSCATSSAAESTYAGVVRLVEQAQASSAPFVRTADRFAVLFVPLTLALAGAGLGGRRHPVARRGRARRRDPVPAAARGPGRDHVGPVPGGAHRRRRQGWRGPGGPGGRAGHALRQDRHADPRPAGAGRRRHRPAPAPTPTRCCASRPPSTRSHPTCSPARSSAPRAAAACDSRAADRRARGARLRARGRRRRARVRLGKAAWIVGDATRRGSGRCAAGPPSTGR